MLIILLVKGFDWETAPWYSIEGLQDIADLHDDVLASGNQYTVENSSTMNFTPEELKYLKHVLSAASSYTIARGEQIDFPTVKHKELLNKIEDQLGKIHWK